ncbi:MAG: redoxin domain-containing protein [Deltaproteobacteria bacterium]
MRKVFLTVLVLACGVCPSASALRGQEFQPKELTVTSFRAPELPPPGEQVSGTTWFNSQPLTMAALHGQVVLIDFWEYTCINCIRTFDDNKKWYERYHKYGFTIVGVHDPEFDIAYPADNVERAVKRFGLPYPIVVDDWFKIWTSYKNSTWPNRFLVDAKGIVRFNRQGEGGDADFERAIQYLLRQAHPGLTFPADYKIPPEKNRFSSACGIPTEEMYVGDWYNRGVISNSEGYHKGKTIDYKMPAQVADGRAGLSGRWETDKNGMIYHGRNKTDPTDDRLEMRYHAREIYSVINVSHGRPSRLYIQQDGKYLTGKNKGVDVQLDPQGRSYLEIREPRMYYLVSNPSFGEHSVSLFPTRPGLTVNSFVFGNDCQLDFSHL